MSTDALGSQIDQMSEKGVLVAAFLEKRLQDNLKLFEQHLPDIYKVFAEYEEQRYYLIHDPDGNVNIFDSEEGKVLFSDNMVAEVLDRLDEYEQKPVCRPYTMIGSGDDSTQAWCPVHVKAIKGIGSIQLKMLNEVAFEGVSKQYSNSGDVEISGIGLPDFINTMFWMSVGPGFDLEKLYKERDVRNLIIIEPESDIFYASLHLMDWGEVINKSIEKGFVIRIYLDDQAEEVVRDVSLSLGKIGRHNVAGAFLYSGIYFERHEKLFKCLQDELNLQVFAGYGFYDDSKMSVAHTYGNLANKVPCIKSDRGISKEFGQKDVPVVVVGNGPSLDNDLPFLRENRDKFILISCGTSLAPLYKNNLKPDFHVEMERPAALLHWIRKISDSDDFDDYLASIRFIGLSQVHPGVFDLFETKGQVPKDIETGSLALRQLFGDQGVPVVSRCGPSCVHAGYTLAVIAGFRNIYLFGTDMGFKDPEYHHSKDSVYTEMGEKTRARVEAKEKYAEHKANFGDDVILAGHYLQLFKYHLEKTVELWETALKGAVKTYNCSDGALIEGVEPKHRDEIDFDDYDQSLNMDEICSGLMDALFAFKPEDKDVEAFESLMAEADEKVSRMSSWLKQKLRSVDSIHEAVEVVDALTYEFHANIDDIGLDPEDSWIYSIYDGTLLYLMSAIQSLLFLPVPEDTRLRAFNEAIDVLDEAFTDIADDFLANKFTPDSLDLHADPFDQGI